MNDARDIFCELLVRIVEGGATPEDRETFRGLLREHPELLAVYREQMRMHVLLRCSFDDGADLCDGDAPAVARRPRAGRRWWPLVVKAAAVVLVGAVFWVASSLHPAAPGLRPAAAGRQAAAIQRIRFSGAAGVALPAALPGTLRLDAGEAAVRLASGVELALLGPLELEVRDAMQVRLASGRLLAEVPPVASGFTVVTPELEIWDIGTVFGVSVSNGVSDVFVFKGEVQVNEASGEAVDLCAAGEGVRAAPGWRPYKVAADWPEAHRIFAAVRGAAGGFGGGLPVLFGADQFVSCRDEPASAARAGRRTHRHPADRENQRQAAQRKGPGRRDVRGHGLPARVNSVYHLQ